MFKTLAELYKLLGTIEIAPWYRNLNWQVEKQNSSLHPEWCSEIGTWSIGPYVRFRIEYQEPDTETGKPDRQCGRWWYIEPDMDEEAVIKTAWLALTVSDEHRRREGFRVNGELIFNPHQPIMRKTRFQTH